MIIFQFFPFVAPYLTLLYTLLYIIYNNQAKFKVTKILCINSIQRSLLAAKSMPLHFLHKVVVNRSAQAFLKWKWSSEACLWKSWWLEVSIRANKFAYRTFLHGLSWLQTFCAGWTQASQNIFRRDIMKLLIGKD